MQDLASGGGPILGPIWAPDRPWEGLFWALFWGPSGRPFASPSEAGLGLGQYSPPGGAQNRALQEPSWTTFEPRSGPKMGLFRRQG